MGMLEVVMMMEKGEEDGGHRRREAHGKAKMMKGKGMSMKKHGYSCMGCLSKAYMAVHGGGRRRAGHEDAKYFDAMVGKCLPAGKRKCAKGCGWHDECDERPSSQRSYGK